MRKKQISLLILGCLAAIGCAGAVFTFNKTQESDSKKFNLKVEDSSSVGTVKITDGGEAAYLDLDDGKVELVNADDVVATYTSVGNDIGKTISYDWTITLSINLATYIQADSISGKWVSGTPITLPKFSYKTDMNPTTLDAYNKMKTALSSADEGITLKCTASVAD